MKKPPTKKTPRTHKRKASRVLFVSTSDAAKILRVSQSIVSRWCREGRIGEKFGRNYMIAKTDLDKFAAAERPVGRPAAKPE